MTAGTSAPTDQQPATASSPDAVAARVRGLRKTFGDTVAIDDVDLDPHEALVRVHDAQICGLVHDGTISPPASSQNLLGANAQVFFIGNAGENNVSAQT